MSENGLIALKSYCYTESFPEGLEEIDLIEVLEMSDYYMLPGMKKVITSYMLNYLQNHNVLDWLLRGKIFCYNYSIFYKKLKLDCSTLDVWKNDVYGILRRISNISIMIPISMKSLFKMQILF